MNTTAVHLDLYSKQNYIFIQAQQYDFNSRFLEATLTNYGDIYTIPENTTAIIEMNKPDNTCVVNDCSISNNKIMIELTEQMLMAPGIAIARITINDNNKKAAISTVDFYIRIQPCPTKHSQVASSNEYQSFIHALNSLGPIIEEGNLLIGNLEALEEALELIKLDALQLIKDTDAARLDTIKATNNAIEATTIANENETKRQTNEANRITVEDTRASSEATRIFNETTRERAEADRNDSEAIRNTSESVRVTAESSRLKAEADRVKTEANRVLAENDRKTTEEGRVEEEKTRIINESARQEKETTRESAEQRRITNENNRATEEVSRVKTEQNRAIGEITRKENETTRINSEATRESQETTRITGENQRVTNEEARVIADKTRTAVEDIRVEAETHRTDEENTRKTNEAIRQEAERKRQTDTKNAIDQADLATNRANQAAESCEEIIDGTGLISRSEKGSALGVATLDENIKLPLSQLTTHTHTFTSLTDKPNTLAEYGITDSFNTSAGTVTKNTDWNTATSSGSYFVADGTMTEACHAPINLSGNGILLVFQYDGDFSKIAQQYFSNETNEPMASRTCDQKGQWTKWIITASKTDINNLEKAVDTRLDTTFTPPPTRTNITSGEKLQISLGKINKWFGDQKGLAFKDKVKLGDLESNIIAHNLSTTDENKVLGADQGPVLLDEVVRLKDNLANGTNKFCKGGVPDGNSFGSSGLVSEVSQEDQGKGYRAGYGFHNAGANGMFLYLEGDKLKYNRNGFATSSTIATTDNLDSLVGNQIQEIKNTINAIQADNKTVYVLSNNVRQTFTYDYLKGSYHGVIKMLDFYPKRDGVVKFNFSIDFITTTGIASISNSAISFYVIPIVTSTEVDADIRTDSSAEYPRLKTDMAQGRSSRTSLSEIIEIPVGTLISKPDSSSGGLSKLLHDTVRGLGNIWFEYNSTTGNYVSQSGCVIASVSAGEMYSFFGGTDSDSRDNKVNVTLDVCYDEVIL